MAWIFSLSAECGSNQENVQQFSQHFKGKYLTLSNEHQYELLVDTFQDYEENWWCRVSPQSVTKVGIISPENADLLTELGILLYQNLKTAPGFRFALVGVEVDEFRTNSELVQELPDLRIPGLVVAADLINLWESSSLFQLFAPGYVWQPYQGEVYHPLLVSSELKSKMEELFGVGVPGN